MELRSRSTQENQYPQITAAAAADVLARADVLLSTPQHRAQLPQTSQASTPPVRNKRKAALRPLENAAKRDTTPKINTILQHVLPQQKPL